MAGRPSKLTPEREEKLLNFIRMGLPIIRACQACGIHVDTYYEWIKKGEDGKEIYSEFSDALREAEASAQAVLVQKLQTEGSSTSWQFILDRRWPDEWGRRDRHEHSGPDGGPVEHIHDVKQATIDALKKLDAL
ncbi:hypothetical protein LCGC14_0773640 [marine sediment metagenome]|uniref:Homeodomain phBC6A51-type domain-containing protein n=1 Tax=marine sediment metagenome TaxID=412755 RepID=A0A0F9QHE9_9ZZZZ